MHLIKIPAQNVTLSKYKLLLVRTHRKKQELEIIEELRLRKAELAREQLQQAKEDSKNDGSNIYVLTVDLQMALAFPTLMRSVAYNNCNMYVYNVGCHELYSGTKR